MVILYNVIRYMVSLYNVIRHMVILYNVIRYYVIVYNVMCYMVIIYNVIRYYVMVYIVIRYMVISPAAYCFLFGLKKKIATYDDRAYNTMQYVARFIFRAKSSGVLLFIWT